MKFILFIIHLSFLFLFVHHANTNKVMRELTENEREAILQGEVPDSIYKYHKEINEKLR